jgi:hypothetical protein
MQKFLKMKINVDGAIITLRRIRPAIVKALLGTAMQAALEVQMDMQIEGRKVKYPIHWASRKQQQAFFASNGFGGSIPYKRTGAYQKGWKVIPIENGVVVGHPWTGAVFLSGNIRGKGQSSIHLGRWPKFKDAINRALARFKNIYAKEMKVKIDVIIKEGNDDGRL